uniref:Uncharacterized protein n=1 Tax=Anguilla anguilla TaxID=7936 RepID=A0A0E9VRT8_ANGAN
MMQSLLRPHIKSSVMLVGRRYLLSNRPLIGKRTFGDELTFYSQKISKFTFRIQK